MFKKMKVSKYIKEINSLFLQDEFTDIFLNSSVLGYSDSTFNRKDYEYLTNFLNNVYNKIIENKEYSKSILDCSDYTFPFTNGWIKLHVLNNKPLGLSFYFKQYSYQFVLDSESKEIVQNALVLSQPKSSVRILNNLNLA